MKRYFFRKKKLIHLCLLFLVKVHYSYFVCNTMYHCLLLLKHIYMHFILLYAKNIDTSVCILSLLGDIR